MKPEPGTVPVIVPAGIVSADKSKLALPCAGTTSLVSVRPIGVESKAMNCDGKFEFGSGSQIRACATSCVTCGPCHERCAAAYPGPDTSVSWVEPSGPPNDIDSVREPVNVLGSFGSTSICVPRSLRPS